MSTNIKGQHKGCEPICTWGICINRLQRRSLFRNTATMLDTMVPDLATNRLNSSWTNSWYQNVSHLTQINGFGLSLKQQQLHRLLSLTVHTSVTALPLFYSQKNPELFQDPMKNFPGPVRNFRMFKYKEKNCIHLQYSECCPLQKTEQEAECGR